MKQGFPARPDIPKGLILILALLAWVAAAADEWVSAPDIGAPFDGLPRQASSEPWDVTRPRGANLREIDFSTDEGTWMSVDVSPDGGWVAFDLLGQVYRVPSAGGEAQPLTADSGVAINMHPRYSPEGDKIAFISDRNGQYGLWVMKADGSGAALVFMDPDSQVFDPVWTPDGKYIAVTRGYRTPGRSWERRNMRIWLFPVTGGKGRELVGGTQDQYNSPAFSPDGRYLYFHVSYFSGNRFGSQSGHHLRRLDLVDGSTQILSEDFDEEQARSFYRVADPSLFPPDNIAEIAPEVSPDGRYLAYVCEVPGKLMTFRGHKLTPRTELRVRDLESGDERVLMDPVTKDLSGAHGIYTYRVFPGYAWSRDSQSIVLSEGGKLRRLQVATGKIETIPFTARVRRVISESVRGKFDINDTAFESKFVQWATASPDGKRLLFVAVGRIWVMDLPDGKPRPLLQARLGNSFEMTPAWSPDGRWIAFTTWDDASRGQLWKVAAAGGKPEQLTREAAEYIYPNWNPDGQSVAVTRGLGVPGRWYSWDYPEDWSVVAVPAAGGQARLLTNLDFIRSTYFGPGGRLYFQHQENVAASWGLYRPFPSDLALNQGATVRSVNLNGDDVRDHLKFTPITPNDGGHRPILSPDGRWVAFQSGQHIFVTPVDPDYQGDEPQRIDPDFTLPETSVRMIGNNGGMFHHWRNPATLEFTSGNRYVTYDAESEALQSIAVNLEIPRNIPSGKIAFTSAKIITIEGDKIIEKGNVVVDGSRIVCVGDCQVSGADRTIDVSGKVIVPGFIDAHAHSVGFQTDVIPQHRPRSAAYLAYGVTTIIDPATVSGSVFPLAEMTEAGLITGPRLFTTAELIIGRGLFFGNVPDIETFQDATREVDRRVDWGAVTIKNFRHSRRDQFQKIIEASRQRGVSVTGEGGPLYFNLGLAMDGQTGWEHMIFPVPLYSDASRFLGSAGIVYSPTIIIVGHPWGSNNYFRSEYDLMTDAKYRRFMPAADIEATLINVVSLSDEHYSYPFLAEGLKDIIRAGGHGAIGEHGESPGIGSHWEMWTYAAALTPLEVLKIASLDGAYFIGLDHETGSIREGKLADLVVLNSDPMENIRNTADIQFVMKAGNLYDGGTLDQIWPEKQAFGPAPWAASGLD